ncbi:MAG: sugar kinase, partial [Chloroflexota bacterium]
MTIDVLTMGEALLRLTPPDYGLMEQSPTLEMHIGGSELNTAVGLARLGKRVMWLSRLTDNLVGRQIERTLRAEGVESSITWTSEDRNGIYYMEEARPPRASTVTYDRDGTAIRNMTPDALPHDLFVNAPRWLHLTGITAALGDTPRATMRTLVTSAKAAGTLISFDVNYRAKLWDSDLAATICSDYLQQSDVIFIARRDAHRLFNLSTEPHHALHQRYPHALIVMTLGADGSVVITPDGEIYEQAIFPAETVCRVGGGDAFASGMLYSLLENMHTADALRFATAAAAVKYTLPGDLPCFSRDMIEAVIDNH